MKSWGARSWADKIVSIQGSWSVVFYRKSFQEVAKLDLILSDHNNIITNSSYSSEKSGTTEFKTFIYEACIIPHANPSILLRLLWMKAIQQRPELLWKVQEVMHLRPHFPAINNWKTAPSADFALTQQQQRKGKHNETAPSPDTASPPAQLGVLRVLS